MDSERKESAKPRGGDRAAASTPVSGGRRRRPDQRSRLLEAIVELVAESGYSAAKVGTLAARAGVSRATFYELFADKEACFLSAAQELATRITLQVQAGIADVDPTGAAPAAMAAIVDFAEREPAAFKFLTHEALLAGKRAQAQRDQLITGFERQIEDASRGAPSGAATPDVPAVLLVRAVIWLLGLHQRRGRNSPSMRDDLAWWVRSYNVSGPRRRWQTSTPEPALRDAKLEIPPGPMAPHPLPRGRHRQPAAVVKRVQRERILHATADTVQAKGFTRTTVADIVASAGLSREVFYAHFRDKRDACVETHKLVFEEFSAPVAHAFFTASDPWPERIWESGRAFTEIIVAAPSFAYLAFIEAYALGEEGAKRADDGILGFTVVLEQGFRQAPEEVPRLVGDAVAAAVMEIVTSCILHEQTEELPGLLPLIAYIILAPFIGVEAANDFIDAKLHGTGR
jgi:AcrR family transcriptional regulator